MDVSKLASRVAEKSLSALAVAPFSWQQTLDVLHGLNKTSQKDDLFALFPKIPVGKPGEGKNNGVGTL